MPRNDGFTYRERVGSVSAGTTVLAHLCARYRHSTPAAWSSRIEAGEVLVDAKRAGVAQALSIGQELSWTRPPWTEPEAPLDYAVLHADDDVMAVAKPAGLPTLPGAGFLRSTLLHQVRRDAPEATAVHRLGRWTSGVVLFARSPSARAELARQMQGARDRQALSRSRLRRSRVGRASRSTVRSGVCRTPGWERSTPMPRTASLRSVTSRSWSGGRARSSATSASRRGARTKSGFTCRRPDILLWAIRST